VTWRRALALAGATLAVALVAGRLLAGAYAEHAWYEALGAEALWRARVGTLTALRTGCFAVAFAFAFVNLLGMRRSIVSLVLPRRVANLHIGEVVPGRALTLTAAVLSVLIAAAVALPQGDWLTVVRARWAMPVGEIDPYLGHDIAFWTAWLPFERMLREWAVVLASVVGVVVMLLYALTPSVQVQGGRLHVSTWVRRHFAIYSGILLLLVAWGFRLDALDLLLRGTGGGERFTSFDHRVLHPYLVALSIGTAGVGVLVAWAGWVGQQRAMLGALLIALVAGPAGRVGLPLLDRRAANAREAAQLERPYDLVRTLYTRRAFAVDEIVRGPAADSVRVPAASIPRRVSGWDPAALALAAGDDASTPPVPGAVAWGVAGGDSLRVLVSYAALGADAPLIPLEVLELDPADADDRGDPWPTEASAHVALPPVVVGLGVDPVRVMPDTLGRIAAPRLGDGWRRVALAWGVRRPRLAVTPADSRQAKLLMRREVRGRIRALVPFLAMGPTTQAFVARDSLWWGVELFHAGADFPLSERIPFAGVSRRFVIAAGLAVVNAHSGRVLVVVPRRPERMTQWWRNRLPELFVTSDRLDAELLDALPPPVDRARMQGTALGRTGFRNDTLSVRPLFQVDEADAELLPGPPTPFVSGLWRGPRAAGVPAVDGTDRVRGAFVAVGGAAQRTMLVEQPDTVRWSAILDRLQRVADSAQFSRTRRHPRRGRVQTIPTDSGLLAVQGFYSWSPERPPTMTGVVALLAGSARTGPSLSAAFGSAPHLPITDARLRLRIARIHAAMQDALRRADWAAFGRAMAELRRLSSDR